MEPVSAWRGNLWNHGQEGQGSNNASNQEEEICHICCDKISMYVHFKPCNHAACAGCVQRLRAANVFKADTGVKCPFCRTFIEECVGDDGSVHVFPASNARLASGAIQPGEGDPQQQQHGLDYLCDGRPQWMCPRPSCSGMMNPAGARQCLGCQSAPPTTTATITSVLTHHPTAHTPVLGPKGGFPLAPRVNLCSRSMGELMAMALEVSGRAVYERALLQDLTDANRDAVVKHVLHGLRTQLVVLAQHPTGCYVVQSVVSAAAYPDPPRGRAGFQAVMEALGPHLPALASHPRGTYTVQRLVSLLKTPQELAMLLKFCGAGRLPSWATQHGHYVLHRLISAAVHFLNDQESGRGSGAGSGVVGGMGAACLVFVCKELLKGATQLAAHSASASLLCDALQEAKHLPKLQAAVLEAVDKVGPALLGSKLGNRILGGMLRCGSPGVSARVLGVMQGRVAELAQDPHDNGGALLRHALAAADLDDTIQDKQTLGRQVVEEIVNGIFSVGESQWLLDILSFSLSFLPKDATKKYYHITEQSIGGLVGSVFKAADQYRSIRMIEEKYAPIHDDSAVQPINVDILQPSASTASTSENISQMSSPRSEIYSHQAPTQPSGLPPDWSVQSTQQDKLQNPDSGYNLDSNMVALEMRFSQLLGNSVNNSIFQNSGNLDTRNINDNGFQSYSEHPPKNSKFPFGPQHGGYEMMESNFPGHYNDVPAENPCTFQEFAAPCNSQLHGTFMGNSLSLSSHNDLNGAELSHGFPFFSENLAFSTANDLLEAQPGNPVDSLQELDKMNAHAYSGIPGWNTQEVFMPNSVAASNNAALNLHEADGTCNDTIAYDSPKQHQSIVDVSNQTNLSLQKVWPGGGTMEMTNKALTSTRKAAYRPPSLVMEMMERQKQVLL